MTLFAALAIPAQARVVYTPLNVTLPANGFYAIDLNHDGITDFYLHTVNSLCGQFGAHIHYLWVERNLPGGGIVGTYDAAALQSGVRIDSSQSFYGSGSLMYQKAIGPGCGAPQGQWGYVYQRYLGLMFLIAGQVHYGWAELSTNSTTGVNTLYGFAYETIPFKGILTGQTMDSPDEPAIDSGLTESKVPSPTAPVAVPTSDSPQLQSSRDNGPTAMAAQDSPSQDHKSKHRQYRLIDMGTLGGPNSFFNGTPPPMINNEGVAAGEADTSAPCLYLGVFVSPAFKWQNGVLMNMGLLPGGCFSLPNAINSKGMMVGAGDIGVIDPQTGLPELRADFRYKGQIINMGTFGGTNSLANGNNSRGQATGGAENTDPDPWNFAGLIGLPSPTAWHGFIWQSGVLQDLGTLGGPDSFGFVINDPGQITGFSFSDSIPNPTTGIPTVAPFLWDRGRMINLGTLGGTFGFGNAVNNHGQVVGFSDVAGDLANHAFFWERGVLTDIGTLGGNNGTANWINDAGQVVGTADLPDGTHHGFIWRKGTMTDLGTIGSDPCSNGSDTNASGQAIGTSTDCNGTILHAFLWENGSMIDLSAQVLPGSGFTFVEPVVINDIGEIVANGRLPNGDTHAVVLKPDGDCDGNCEGRIAASQNIVTPAQNPATEMQGSETLVSPLERFRSQIRQRYHLPGQPAAPRD
jgi:probable HAF family extracellular repeat protein